MIRTSLWLGWTQLKRDRIALGIVFVLPLLFFSIFALVFGGMSGGGGGGGGSSKPVTLKVLAVDLDQSETSRRLIAVLDQQPELEVQTRPDSTAAAESDAEPVTWDSQQARSQVRSGRYVAAIVLPAGFGEQFPNFTGSGPAIELIYDGSNPMAQPTLAGLLQASAFTAVPDLLLDRGFEQLAAVGWSLSPQQAAIFDGFKRALRGEQSWQQLLGQDDSPADPASPETEDADAAAPNGETGQEGNDPQDEDQDAGNAPPAAGGLDSFLKIESSEARAEVTETKGNQPTRSALVSYYAAGIGVMFLLFSMTGASSSLLEEEENGTLERVLTCSGSIHALLFGRWIFFALVGILQVILMFVWGALVFGLELWTTNHLAGFLAMTMVTALAAAAFAMMLAAVCRSRAQLNGIGTIVILIMSAVGGSMMPRFVMPEFMQKAGVLTFNGWALDGYLKVFWYDNPQHSLLQSLATLLPQLAVLSLLTVAFLFVARLFARRWEAV